MLVERNFAHIETIDRIGETWSGFGIAKEMTAALDLASVGIEIPLAEIYADVISS